MEDADAFLASLLQFSSPSIESGIQQQQQQQQRDGAVTAPCASSSSAVAPPSSQQHHRRQQRDDDSDPVVVPETSLQSSRALAVPPSYVRGVRDANASGAWWCSRCTAENSVHMLSCALCHRRRHRVEGPPPPPPRMTSSGAHEQWPVSEPVVIPGPGEVSCLRCTFLNPSSRRTCEMCDAALPQPPSRSPETVASCKTTVNHDGVFQGAVGTTATMSSSVLSGHSAAAAASVPSTVLVDLTGHVRQQSEGSSAYQPPCSPGTGNPVRLQECNRETLSISPVSIGSRSTQTSSSGSDEDDGGESGEEWGDDQEVATRDAADHHRLVQFLETLQSVKFDTLPCAAVPATMRARGELRQFQLQALHWLLSREQSQCARTRAVAVDTSSRTMKKSSKNFTEDGVESCTDGVHGVTCTPSGRSAPGGGGGTLDGCSSGEAVKYSVAASASSAMQPISSYHADDTTPISDSSAEDETRLFLGEEDTMRTVRGGFLADYMGLGKTRTLIALCEAARHRRIDRVTGSLVESTATLIVCPTSLLLQWVSEIERCVERPAGAPLRILLYHGSRKRRLSLFQVAQSYDYVLTTYQTLSNSQPPTSRSGPRDLDRGLAISGGDHATAAADFCNMEELTANESPLGLVGEYDVNLRLQKKVGTLFMIRWARIILDEAHYIRNMRTNQSRACLKLSGVCRWVVTATPIQNSLNDLYPLLRFLDVPHFSSLAWWNQEIVRYYNVDPNHPRPVTALSILFGSILLRRTPDSIVDGRPILSLPSKTVITHTVRLSRYEMRFYQSIHKRATEKLNALRNREAYAMRTPLSTFTTAFEMLVRCRQTCLHPYIVVAALRRCHRLPGLGVDTHSSATLDGVSASVKGASGEAEQQQREDEVRTARLIDSFLQTVVLRRLRTIKTKEFVQSLVDEIKHQKLESRECIICLDTVNRPAILPCAHVFCEECIMHALEATRRCPLCKRNSKPSELLLVPLEILQRTAQRSQTSVDGGSRGADGKANAADMAPEVPLSLDLTDMNNWSLQLSSKTQYLVDTIRRLPVEDKVVVFSSFLVYLRCAQHWLQAAGISCAIYCGSMTMKQKKTLLERFNDADHPASSRVLLATTSSCGVGLNLTCANHCFLMEPSWNPGTEEQALNRIHRIGQKKPVTITKLIAEGTVEQNISQLCERKRALSGYCFSDGVAGGAAVGGSRGGDGRLRTSDLLELFAPEKSACSSDDSEDSSEEDEDG